MSIRHKKFVESIRINVNEDESLSQLLSSILRDESDEYSSDFHKKLKRHFNEFFDFNDDDD